MHSLALPHKTKQQRVTLPNADLASSHQKTSPSILRRACVAPITSSVRYPKLHSAIGIHAFGALVMDVDNPISTSIPAFPLRRIRPHAEQLRVLVSTHSRAIKVRAGSMGCDLKKTPTRSQTS
jgi:hypothetical protein